LSNLRKNGGNSLVDIPLVGFLFLNMLKCRGRSCVHGKLSFSSQNLLQKRVNHSNWLLI
jgi:hypothetical protein